MLVLFTLTAQARTKFHFANLGITIMSMVIV